jgi:hypothetical protein
MKSINHSTAMNTSVTICGKATSSSEIISFMPNSDNVSEQCLANNYNGKSIEFTCTVDANKNPKQNCFNALAFFCGRSQLEGGLGPVLSCKERVDDNFSKMNAFWITWRRECGRWAWTDGYIGNPSSSYCSAARLALEQNAKYDVMWIGTFAVPRLALDSIHQALWDNPSIQ